MTFDPSALTSPVLAAVLRLLAWWPPLPPTLAGPLLGALLSRLTLADVAGAVEIGAAVLLAIAWVTAPALLGAAPCGDADGAVQ